MDFEIKKKKVVWSIIISVLGSTLFWYLTSMGAIFETDNEIAEKVEVLSSINPLGQGIGYLMVFLILMYLVFFAVVYILWSVLERES